MISLLETNSQKGRNDNMDKPVVGVLTVTETRDEFYEKRKDILAEECDKFKKVFSQDFDMIFSEPIRHVDSSLYWALETQKREANAVIIHMPIWASPNLSTKIASNVNVPILILGNDRPESSSMVSLLAAAGAIEQGGKKVKRVLGNLADEKLKIQVMAFIKACQAVGELRKSNYCVLGGRSIGIGTTVADFSQWQKLFGIECDHRDQFEIVLRAEKIDKSRTNLYLDWLKKNIGQINFGGLFTLESLKRQINSYLAIKDIVKEGHYSFLGLKCQTEMSNNYAIQCLAIALLGDNYDAEGYKEPIPCSCEADNDGALTMKILSLISGGMPSNLMDIRMLKRESKEMVFANCGGMPTFFACGSNKPEENLKNIHMMESVFGTAGGGTLQFVCSKTAITLARMFRVNGEYIMGIIEGEFEQKPREELRQTTYCFPHGFVKADIDYDLFFNTIGANHMHAVYGHHLEALEHFCNILEIRYIKYNT